MNVEINEVVSTVRAVDGQALVSPQVLRRLVDALMRAVNDQREHEKRTQKENRVTGGVSAERDQEE